MAIYKSNDEKTKDNKKWYFKCTYHDIYGNAKQKKSKKFLTKEEAIKEEAKFLLSIGEAKQKTIVTFNDAYNELIEIKSKKVRPQTLKKEINYYKHIEKELGNICINKLTLEQMTHWKNIINSKNLKCSYKKKIFKFLNQLVTHAELYYKVTTDVLRLSGNFVDISESKKEIDFFTLDEFNKFISVIDDDFWRLLFNTLFFCGIRQGELQALTWNDLNFNENTIRINKTLTTKIKGEKWSIFPPKTKSSYRTIPLTNSLTIQLNALYKNQIKIDGFSNDWFIFGGVNPTPESTIQHKKNNYCKKANLKQIRIHDFRHSCASLLISKNADPTIVAKFLGHADVNMTLNTYSHMYKSKLNEIISIFEC